MQRKKKQFMTDRRTLAGNSATYPWRLWIRSHNFIVKKFLTDCCGHPSCVLSIPLLLAGKEEQIASSVHQEWYLMFRIRSKLHVRVHEVSTAETLDPLNHFEPKGIEELSSFSHYLWVGKQFFSYCTSTWLYTSKLANSFLFPVFFPLVVNYFLSI